MAGAEDDDGVEIASDQLLIGRGRDLAGEFVARMRTNQGAEIFDRLGLCLGQVLVDLFCKIGFGLGIEKPGDRRPADFFKRLFLPGRRLRL